jgi:hypothetical protein
MSIKKTIKSLSLLNHIPVKDIEYIINYQFKFVKNVMESATKNEEDTFKFVSLPHLGKFVVPIGKIAILAKIAKDRELNNKNKDNGEETSK